MVLVLLFLMSFMLNVIMLSVTNKPFMFYFIMQYVVMMSVTLLNVVVPLYVVNYHSQPRLVQKLSLSLALLLPYQH
jgi:hypothetical protein